MPVLPVLPPQLVVLAQLVTAEVLLGKPLAAAAPAGAGPKAGVDVAAATRVVLRNLRLPDAQALRTFLLTYAAAAAPTAPPTAQLTPLQLHAAVLCVARAFCAPLPQPPGAAAAQPRPRPQACTK